MSQPKPYPEIEANPNFAKLEQEILAGWKASNTFEQSVSAREGSPEYVFYDGPPFANGLPHYGHLLTGYVKDVYARYHTMKGQKVERRFGWDCHGLPAEMGAEKELVISGRQAIQNFGIQNFNEHCRTSVMKYAGEWEGYVDRQARWVDFKNDYKTMDKNFMESVLWAFKQLYDKGLVYESYRVMPYSWAAETPLSNFETKLDNSYRNRTDKAVTVKFKLREKPNGAPDADNYYVLAWTTTPWTLPSNLALAVSGEMGYTAYLSEDGNRYIAADNAIFPLRDSLKLVSSAEWMESDVVKKQEQDKRMLHNAPVTYLGKELIGLTYEPLFPYFADTPNAFRILDGSDFIEEGSGTGVVHMAPGFGEDDQRVCKANGIDVVVPVDEQGKYTDEVYDIPLHTSSCGAQSASAGSEADAAQAKASQHDAVLSLKGLNVIADTRKSADEPYTDDQLKKYGLANLRIIAWLKENDKLIKQDDYNHNYPHCWRTDTPLIYRALPSWYVAVTKFRDRAVELNQNINWIPEHIRDGQMGHMLATAPDWSISRNRFWGTPIPIWRKQDGSGDIKVFGSIAELEEFFVNPSSPHLTSPRLRGEEERETLGGGHGWLTDLHRPYIDQLTTAKDGSQWQRVSDVFDCWFESGSMPFAQVHYPFENKDWFDTHFPADFITEYVGQTRGWFNTLIMLSTALFDKEPFKNCICHGVVIDEETGLKYSKRLKNYKDPMEVFDKYGSDALRWLMLASPVMRGADLGVDPDGKFIHDVVRLYIKPMWNAYYFFTLYANADGVKAKHNTSSTNLMDRYILAKCADAVRAVDTGLAAYDSPSACKAVSDFFEVLNNWYIRRNKDRFWNEGGEGADTSAYDTLYTVLTTIAQAAAPLLPLTTEAIYGGLTGEGSVHLKDFPDLKDFASAEEKRAVILPTKHLTKKDLEWSDNQLIRYMELVRDICNVALSIRNEEKIRVRQPLYKLTYYGESGHLISESMSDIIEDEINVHEYGYAPSEKIQEVATRTLKLNSQVIGKRLPAKMKELIPASKQGKWEMKDGALHICGEVLLPEEYELNLEPKAGIKGAAPLSSNDALVVLDLTLTPELEAEGLARDVIRMIQDARKKADLNVSDRIALSYSAGGKVGQAIAAHEAMIAEQVLATSISQGKAESADHHFEQELGGEQVTIAFSVAKAKAA